MNFKWETEIDYILTTPERQSWYSLPEFEPGDIVWELLLEASESLVVSGLPLRER